MLVLFIIHDLNCNICYLKVFIIFTNVQPWILILDLTSLLQSHIPNIHTVPERDRKKILETLTYMNWNPIWIDPWFSLSV